MSQRETEKLLPGLKGFDTWEDGRILQELQSGQERALKAVRKAHPAIARAAREIAKRLKAGGKIIYAGAGTSIRIGVQDGTELPATFGLPDYQIAYLIAGGRGAIFSTRADGEDDVAKAHRDARICDSKDALIAIAASGRTPYTIGAAQAARANGCYVVAMVNTSGSALAKASDLEILLDTGPEVIAGSTRLGAGTAQKAALNLLSTLVNVRLGAVYDGLMVNVEQGNSKLAERALVIVSHIAKCDMKKAAKALEASGGNLKEAIVMCAGAKTVARARDILETCDGHLRQALRALKSSASARLTKR